MPKNIYTGFHAIEEKLKKYSLNISPEIILRIFYSKTGPRIKKIIELAKKNGFSVSLVSETELSSLVSSLPETARDHRGIVLTVEGEKEKAQNFVQFEQWLSSCPSEATVVVLDGVTDPHNVGAILRSCDQFGANLLLISEHRSAEISESEVIARSSAGASSWVNVAKVTNLVRSVQLLKSTGFWVYGADAGGTPLQEEKFSSKTCIIMGSEGKGIAHLLREQCDKILSIPTCGRLDSLNVSVASGIFLYEIHCQKLKG